MKETYKVGVEYVFQGVLSNVNISTSKKMETDVGYRVKGDTRLIDFLTEKYVDDEGHMAIDHAFDTKYAGKTMEIIFHTGNPEHGIVITVTLESEYFLESTYIHDHLQNVAKDIIAEQGEGDSSIMNQFYTKIADGSIPNPTIRVERTPNINSVAEYDKSTQEIIVNDALLYNIQEDEEQKLALIQELSKAYSKYLNHQVQETDIGSKAAEGAACTVFRFDEAKDNTIHIGKLNSPEYTGDLVLDFAAEQSDEGQWDSADTTAGPTAMSSTTTVDALDETYLCTTFQYDVDKGFTATTQPEMFAKSTNTETSPEAPSRIVGKDEQGNFRIFMMGQKNETDPIDPTDPKKKKKEKKESTDKEDTLIADYIPVDLRHVGLSISASKTATYFGIEASHISTIPVFDEQGKKIGQWVSHVKVPYKALKIVGGVLEKTGYIVNFVNFIANTEKVIKGKLSLGHYSYKTIGMGVTLYIGSIAVAPVTLTVGGIVYLGDLFYEANEVSLKLRQQTAEHSRYRIYPPNDAEWYEAKFWESMWNQMCSFMPH